MSKIGQQFVIVNKTRKEYIDPVNLDDSMKLWSVCTGDVPRLLPYLLVCPADGNQIVEPVPDAVFAGRWAGDEIGVMGQDSETGLYQKARESDEWTEIGEDVRAEFNEWVGTDEYRV